MSTATYFAANSGKNVYFFRVGLNPKRLSKNSSKVQAWHFAANTYQEAEDKVTTDLDVTGYKVVSIRLTNGEWIPNPVNPTDYDILG